MVMKLKANGHGSFLNGSRDNYFPVDNVDPMYKMFLEHLRKDQKSYILEMEDGDNGLPVFVKYENNDELLDFLQLEAPMSSGHCNFVWKGRYKTKKRRIYRKLEPQSNGIVEFSGFPSNQVENTLLVDNNKEFQRFGNRSVDLSADFLKNQAESNLADDSYQEFLSFLKIQDGLMVLEYNSITVIYEGNETAAAAERTCFDGQGPLPLQSFGSTQLPSSPKPANEGASRSDNQELVLYGSNLPPDVVICEADDMSIVPVNSYILSPFDLELMAVLSKPYDGQEHEVLWKHANFRKPVLRHKDLRSQSKSFSTRQMGFSYLDHFPDLARKLEHSDPQQALNLLRGLFFWLKLEHSAARRPSRSAKIFPSRCPNSALFTSSAMAYRNGALFRENWLRDEVLYLHGLWHQGSQRSSTGNSNTSTNRNTALTHLRPRSSGKLIKDRKHHRPRKKADSSEKEWPCDPASDPNKVVVTGWPEPPPKPAPRPTSAEDIAAALAARAQKNGVEECKRFFSMKGIDGDNDEGDSAGELEEEDVEEEEEVEERAFKLFMEIFTKDNELRKYYEANHEKGEFLCLVCEGSGAKKGRTYGDCVGLVQHCSSLAKTGRRAAHRALARVLCRVVGWNFDRLPMLVLDLEETLGQRLARDASPPQERSEETEQIQNEATE